MTIRGSNVLLLLVWYGREIIPAMTVSGLNILLLSGMTGK